MPPRAAFFHLCWRCPCPPKRGTPVWGGKRRRFPSSKKKEAQPITSKSHKAKRYTDIMELTPELLRLFIEKIVVHEKEVKWSKHAPQTVEIYYNGIGCMTGSQRQNTESPQSQETAEPPTGIVNTITGRSIPGSSCYPCQGGTTALSVAFRICPQPCKQTVRLLTCRASLRYTRSPQRSQRVVYSSEQAWHSLSTPNLIICLLGPRFPQQTQRKHFSAMILPSFHYI